MTRAGRNKLSTIEMSESLGKDISLENIKMSKKTSQNKTGVKKVSNYQCMHNGARNPRGNYSNYMNGDKHQEIPKVS